jgi:hypothetical protein
MRYCSGPQPLQVVCATKGLTSTRQAWVVIAGAASVPLPVVMIGVGTWAHSGGMSALPGSHKRLLGVDERSVQYCRHVAVHGAAAGATGAKVT